jgi:hypothetical protein
VNWGALAAAVTIAGCGAESAASSTEPIDGGVVADARASESLEHTVYVDAADAFSAPAEIIVRLNLLAQDRCLPRRVGRSSRIWEAGSEAVGCTGDKDRRQLQGPEAPRSPRKRYEFTVRAHRRAGTFVVRVVGAHRYASRLRHVAERFAAQHRALPERRPPVGRGRRRVEWLVGRREKSADAGGVGEHRHELHPALALGTLENVDRKCPT